MKTHYLKLATVATMVVALSACGSKVPRPDSELALAGSALKSAELSGAREHAPLELRHARAKKAAADAAIEDKKYSKARYLTIEARVDAELARAAADAEKSRQELQRAQDSIESLRDEVLPASNTQ